MINSKTNYDNPFKEWILDLIIICLAINAVAEQSRWWFLQRVYPGDFVIYYNAAMGVFSPGWLYKDWTAFIFKPLLYWNPFDSYTYWCGFQTTCFLILTHKMLEVKYGWVLVIIALTSFHDLLQVGNIQITLCLVAVYAYPSFLVILIKPHYAIFALSHTIATRYRIWVGARDSIDKRK